MRVITERFLSNSYLFSRSTILLGIIDLRTIVIVKRILIIVSSREDKKSTQYRKEVNIGLKIYILIILIQLDVLQTSRVINNRIKKSLSIKVIRINKYSLNSLYIQLLLTVLYLSSKVYRLLTNLLSYKSIKNNIIEVQVIYKPTIMKLH